VEHAICFPASSATWASLHYREAPVPTSRRQWRWRGKEIGEWLTWRHLNANDISRQGGNSMAEVLYSEDTVVQSINSKRTTTLGVADVAGTQVARV
jgi:hypothetical protein